MQERGKYARLCVEVDLTKSLLAMFMIKGRKYNVEYEGLHLLCKNCGKFGHYSEGCPDKRKPVAVHHDAGRANGGHKNGGEDLPGSNVDGPWMVVQKQRRARKGKEKDMIVPKLPEGGGKSGPLRINAAGKLNGSRFGALMTDTEEDLQEIVNQEDKGDDPMETRHVDEGRKNDSKNKNQSYEAIIGLHDEGTEKGENNSVIIANQVIDVDCFIKEGSDVMSCQPRATNQDKTARDAKLGARVTGSFKGRSSSKSSGRAHVDTMVVNKEQNKLAGIFKDQFNRERDQGKKEMRINETQNDKGESNFHDTGLHLGPTMNGEPNAPRPPDLLNVPPFISSPPFLQLKEDTIIEKENFLDASDQVGDGSSDSDMEIVKETPIGDF
jgi:hypothetical protein